MLLCYISGGDPPEKLAAALTAGLDYVQIREKELSGRALHELCCWAGAVPRTTRLLLNDRLDVALACGLDGVHLPAGRPSPQLFRSATGRPLVIGVSCHTLEEVHRAADEGADYVLLAPIFSSPGKGPPLGLAVLEQAARETVPVLALGGITMQNAHDCIEAGAAGIAAIRLFQQAADMAAVVKHLRATADEHR